MTTTASHDGGVAMAVRGTSQPATRDWAAGFSREQIKVQKVPGGYRAAWKKLARTGSTKDVALDRLVETFNRARELMGASSVRRRRAAS